MPVLIINVYGPQKEPFDSLIKTLDQLEEDGIYFATGGTRRCTYWGKLLTATARTRKAAGVVVNGWYYDTLRVFG